MDRYIIVFALVALGCSHDRSNGGNGATEGPQVSAASLTGSQKEIGSACVAEDGWQATGDSASAAATDEKQPQALAVPEGEIDFPSLPPRVGYCLDPGGVYPHGYFTSNCASDSDCPRGSACDDVHCRRPCTADKECAPPTTCGAPAGKLQARFCSCPDCAKRPGPSEKPAP